MTPDHLAGKVRDAQRALAEAQEQRDAAPIGSDAYREAVRAVGQRWRHLRKLFADFESEAAAVGGSSSSPE